MSQVMTWKRWGVLVALVTLAADARTAFAQENRIDMVAPTAPDLAPYGSHAIGVRTLRATDPNRPDILKTTAGGPTARYDRTLTLEVWYPAALAGTERAGGDYRAITRDPAVTVTLRGRAVRDAAPLAAGAPFPLVIVSHGYPGNRYLMSHLAENLASKGYVVTSIDHADSTYDDQKSFGSTLYNRPFDQLFVLNEMARLGAAGSGSFLAGRVDASRTGIVGYSMGGYGLVNVIGGGYSTAAAAFPASPPEPPAARAGRRHTGLSGRARSAHQGGSWPLVRGACRRATGMLRVWPASARPRSSWPAAPTTCRATRRARAPSSPAPSTPNATCSRS